MNIGQPNFIEVISAQPFVGQSCKALIRLGSSHWQNPVNRFDVNNDGVVDISDYTVLQNWLDENGSKTLSALKPDSEPYVDINGDGKADILDLTLLAQFINEGDAVNRDSLEECFPSTDFRLQRDLLDPALVQRVKQAAATKGLVPFINYKAYLRDFLTNELTEVEFETAVKTKDSLVFVHVDLLTVEESRVLPVRSLNTTSWQNPINQYDINADGIIDQDDIDILTDWLDTHDAFLETTRLAGEPFVDVNGDGFSTTVDLSLLMTFIADNGITEVGQLVTTSVISAGTTTTCTPTFPVLDRIKVRIRNSEILPARFVWPQPA